MKKDEIPSRKAPFLQLEPCKHQLIQRLNIFNQFSSWNRKVGTEILHHSNMCSLVSRTREDNIFGYWESFTEKKLFFTGLDGRTTTKNVVLFDYKACQKQSSFPAKNFISFSSRASFRQVFSFPIQAADIPGTRNSQKSTLTRDKSN